MAATVSWDGLRELAGFRAQKGCAISLYLDLDPSTTPTLGDARSRVNALINEAAKRAAAAGEGHEERQALRGDIDRLERFFEEEFNRDGARGVAVFAAGLDNVWNVLSLADAVPDAVKVGREFYLAPLVPLVGRGDGALVAVVGRERGRLYRLRGGKLVELSDHTEEQPGRHDQGGWSQANYQRHIEKLAQDHLRDVADALDRWFRRLQRPRVIVVTTEETRPELEDALSADVTSAVIGWTTAEAHATAAHLHELTAPILEEWRAGRESELVDRWREAEGQGARATSGWVDTLEAGSDGRVDVLLYQEGADHPAYSCPACGRAAVSAGACPLDGTTMEPHDEGLELAVRQTLAHGGTVWVVRRRPDLATSEGVGALLRY